MKKIENIKKNIPIILFSILPISIIIGSSFSLINTVLLGLCFLLVYFSKDNIKINDFKPVFFLIILYLYLIFNSLISIDISSGIYRNFGFIRFILFFLIINYIFFIYEKNSNILKIWTIIFFVVLIDVYIERFTGSNIFGFGKLEIDGVPQPYANRVISFFRTEPIAGAFLCGFGFIIIGYVLNFLKSKKILKIFGFLLILLCLAGVILTGERSNGLKALIGFLIFISIIDYVKLKGKILIFLSIFTIFFITINFSDYIKLRYVDRFFNDLKTEDSRAKFLENSLYIKLYKSGIYVFKNNPWFGVGNKNYRVESCDPKKNSVYKEYWCLTHPHQVYIEMLSEHGVIGTIIILSIIFYLIFRIIRKIIDSKNYIQTGCLVFLLINFVPILPSGSFFNNFNLTLFMVNFSLMYAINKETNIFSKK
tara:strand:+ start:12155 stop:13423 length:1269 start_codon:yes stop_codon:yes gene_type:complete